MPIRITHPYFAKIVIGSLANFKMRIKFPKYPVRVARIVIASDANVQIGGDLFTRLRVMDQSEGGVGEHKEQIDLDGAITLGGIAGDEMEFLTDIAFSGQNLVAATTKLLLQFEVIGGSR